MAKATPAEKLRLAKHAKTTLGTLRQVAGAYRSDGVLTVSSDFAARIEAATIAMNRTNAKLPVVLRIHLSPVCARCEWSVFAKHAR